jgi:hypothetical protein
LRPSTKPKASAEIVVSELVSVIEKIVAEQFSVFSKQESSENQC